VNGRRRGGETFHGQRLKEGGRPPRVGLWFSGAPPRDGTGMVRYALGVHETASAPWADPPAAPLAGRALDARGAETASAPWADPPELVAVRASMSEAQERVDRATRQLGLAAELEARLRALLEEQSGQGVPPVASPERQAAELEATAILLKAELRAAKILNDSGNPDSYKPAAIELESARALEGHLAQLADIEVTMAAIARELVRHEIAGDPGPSLLALDGGPARQRARPVSPSVPVPMFRRPRRGKQT
jgi:hypothetical protein